MPGIAHKFWPKNPDFREMDPNFENLKIFIKYCSTFEKINLLLIM